MAHYGISLIYAAILIAFSCDNEVIDPFETYDCQSNCAMITGNPAGTITTLTIENYTWNFSVGGTSYILEYYPESVQTCDSPDTATEWYQLIGYEGGSVSVDNAYALYRVDANNNLYFISNNNTYLTTGCANASYFVKRTK